MYTEKQIAEYKKIYKDTYLIDIKDTDYNSQSSKLLNLVNILIKAAKEKN